MSQLISSGGAQLQHQSFHISFSWASKSTWTVTAATKLKDTPWKNSYDKTKQCIKKQRHHLSIKVRIVKAMAFPVVMDGCESKPKFTWYFILCSVVCFLIQSSSFDYPASALPTLAPSSLYFTTLLREVLGGLLFSTVIGWCRRLVRYGVWL